MNKNVNLLDLVFPFDFDKLNSILGNSEQANYLYDYLDYLKAHTCIIEEEYIDKDYLIDYSNFYSRSFNEIERFTKRVHFFYEKFSKEEFMRVLINRDEDLIEKLDKSYLGFIIIKPIKDSRGNPLIGRTILRTYPRDDRDEKRFYLNGSYDVSLLGIPLTIESLPFQTQDTAVGACATAACWIASHPLSNLFGIQQNSPFEVTEMSVSFPSLERNFPSPGLTLFQIKNYFNLIGLKTEFIDTTKTQNIENYTSDDDIIADAVRAYSKMGLPIIASLLLKKGNIKEYHAVVISGYRYKHGNVKELYVHDDQIGPYSKVIPCGNFIKWENRWTINGPFSDLFVIKLVIPIYPKIRLSFGRIYEVFLKKHKRRMDFLIQSCIIDQKLTPILYLMDVKQYKKFIWEHSCEDKEQKLSKFFPRFLWVIRYTFHGVPIMDYVYDGTSVFAEEIDCIIFKNQ